MQQCIKILLFHLYGAQRVSGDTPSIIGSIKLHWQPLVFHTWEVVGRIDGGRCQAQCDRGFQCTFRLLMMGGVSPETCWASYKWNNKLLIHCCILLDFSLWKYIPFYMSQRCTALWWDKLSSNQLKQPCSNYALVQIQLFLTPNQVPSLNITFIHYSTLPDMRFPRFMLGKTATIENYVYLRKLKRRLNSRKIYFWNPSSSGLLSRYIRH